LGHQNRISPTVACVETIATAPSVALRMNPRRAIFVAAGALTKWSRAKSDKQRATSQFNPSPESDRKIEVILVRLYLL
jgi:hypothetical protein